MAAPATTSHPSMARASEDEFESDPWRVSQIICTSSPLLPDRDTDPGSREGRSSDLGFVPPSSFASQGSLLPAHPTAAEHPPEDPDPAPRGDVSTSKSVVFEDDRQRNNFVVTFLFVTVGVGLFVYDYKYDKTVDKLTYGVKTTMLLHGGFMVVIWSLIAFGTVVATIKPEGWLSTHAFVQKFGSFLSIFAFYFAYRGRDTDDEEGSLVAPPLGKHASCGIALLAATYIMNVTGRILAHDRDPDQHGPFGIPFTRLHVNNCWKPSEATKGWILASHVLMGRVMVLGSFSTMFLGFVKFVHQYNVQLSALATDAIYSTYFMITGGASLALVLIWFRFWRPTVGAPSRASAATQRQRQMANQRAMAQSQGHLQDHPSRNSSAALSLPEQDLASSFGI